MRFSRARYVTLCQQSLVTAAVLAVGLTAAGVKTLDIVPQPGDAAGQRGTAAGTPVLRGGSDLIDPGTHERSDVDSAPVTPKVREVAVVAPKSSTSARRAPQASPGAKAPQTTKSMKSTPTGGTVETAPQTVQGYATVGVTWEHGLNYAENQIRIQVRTEKKGAWSRWMKIQYHDDHGPDGSTSEGESTKDRPGTDPLVIGDVDRVQMRATTTGAGIPSDMKLAIIDPGSGALTKQAPAIDTNKLADPGSKAASSSEAAGATSSLQGDGTSDDVSLSAMVRSPKPYIYSRAQWGANEKIREQGPPQYGTVETGFIHHTVNANNYTRAQVPALIRGIYAYHVESRGWRDIGYNFLVDRFGRIWEGRYGGVNRAVVGAHTLGYNEVSFAMSAIGNFDIAKPPPAVVAAYARLFAWKLSIYNIRANNPRILVKGRWLHAINGHRDVGQTACPGRYLYARIPYIRNAARNIQLKAQKGGGVGSTSSPPPPSTTFSSPTQTPRAAVAQPKTITFPHSTNVTGSAYPDLLVKSRATGAIRVLPTGGQTGFRSTATTRGSWSSMNLLTAAGDLTGDGKGDVVARATRTGLTRVYAGDGHGHVTVAGINATDRFKTANLLVGAGDWTGDGKNDVLMRTKTSGSLYVVPGTGKGTWGQPKLLSNAWAGYTQTAVAGDLNGDGHPDIVGVRGGYLYVAPGTAGGGLGTPVKQDAFDGNDVALVGGGHDLNGDGIGDVVVQTKSGALEILTGKGDGTFGPMLGPFTGVAGLGRLSSGQMGGTDQPDVVGVDSTGKKLITVYSNGLVNTGKSLATGVRDKGATQVLSVGDWNRDGKADMITRDNSGDTLTLHPGNGDGTFGAGVKMSDGWSTITTLAAVGDVTGDKIPDLVGKTANGAMTIYPGNGKTGFQAPILAPATLRTFNQVGAGAWRSAGLPGSGFLSSDDSFVPFSGTAAGSLAGYDWVIGAGDVDGNGVADLIVRDTNGTLWLLPGTSTGYLERRYLAAGYKGYSLGAG